MASLANQALQEGENHLVALIALGGAKVEQGKNDPLTVQLMKEGVSHLEEAWNLAETNTDVSHDLLT